MRIKEKINCINEEISYIITHARFLYNTEILPLFVPHHKCVFYDWVNGFERGGWYINDKNGNMIPWVHFNKRCLICLYSDMIKKI